MDSLSLVLLGVIALASLFQAVALLVIAGEGRRMFRRLDAFAERLGRDVRPAVADLERASENFADVSGLAAVQARRLDALVEEAVERIERASDVLRRVILPSAGRLVAAAVVFRGIRKGLLILRRRRARPPTQEKRVGVEPARSPQAPRAPRGQPHARRAAPRRAARGEGQGPRRQPYPRPQGPARRACLPGAPRRQRGRPPPGVLAARGGCAP